MFVPSTSVRGGMAVPHSGHASSDATDGYAHAELSEMLAALIRLSSPQASPKQAIKTGTTEVPLPVSQPSARADHRLDSGPTMQGQSLALNGTAGGPAGCVRCQGRIEMSACQDGGSCYNPTADSHLHTLAMIGSESEGKCSISR